MSSYKYNIKMTYINNDEEILIDNKYIHNVMIDYDYMTKNRPMIFISASIDNNIIDKMIKNKDTDKIVLTIDKYDTEASFKIMNNYIKEEYIYFIQDTPNNKKSFDYEGTEEDSDDKFKRINIGLMNDKLINLNKVLTNAVIHKSALSNVLINYLSKELPVLIEPIVDDIIIDNFIIPPITTLTKLVEYLNNYYPIYDTRYRLFFDNNRGYLISSSGKSVEAKDEEYSSVIMYVKDTITMDSKAQGIYIDRVDKAYIVNLDTKDLSVYKSNTKVNTDTIIGIDSDGNINKGHLNTKGSKVIINKVSNINTTNINTNELSSEIMLNIVKTDIDTSIMTMNKEYNIKSDTNEMKDLTGKYILTRKREVFVRQGEEFIISCILGMKQIKRP